MYSVIEKVRKIQASTSSSSSSEDLLHDCNIGRGAVAVVGAKEATSSSDDDEVMVLTNPGTSTESGTSRQIGGGREGLSAQRDSGQIVKCRSHGGGKWNGGDESDFSGLSSIGLKKDDDGVRTNDDESDVSGLSSIGLKKGDEGRNGKLKGGDESDVSGWGSAGAGQGNAANGKWNGGDESDVSGLSSIGLKKGDEGRNGKWNSDSDVSGLSSVGAEQGNRKSGMVTVDDESDVSALCSVGGQKAGEKSGLDWKSEESDFSGLNSVGVKKNEDKWKSEESDFSGLSSVDPERKDEKRGVVDQLVSDDSTDDVVGGASPMRKSKREDFVGKDSVDGDHRIGFDMVQGYRNTDSDESSDDVRPIDSGRYRKTETKRRVTDESSDDDRSDQSETRLVEHAYHVDNELITESDSYEEDEDPFPVLRRCESSQPPLPTEKPNAETRLQERLREAREKYVQMVNDALRELGIERYQVDTPPAFELMSDREMEEELAGFGFRFVNRTNAIDKLTRCWAAKRNSGGTSTKSLTPAEFIREKSQYYEQIITYQPIPLAGLFHELTEHGIKVSIHSLRKLLDDEGVAFLDDDAARR